MCFDKCVCERLLDFVYLILQVQKLFLDFNKFNIVLTEQLWYLDLENKSEVFVEEVGKIHTGTVYTLE